MQGPSGNRGNRQRSGSSHLLSDGDRATFVASDIARSSYPGFWKPGVPYATWLRRLVAYLIDIAPFMALILAIDVWEIHANRCTATNSQCSKLNLPAGIAIPVHWDTGVELFLTELVVIAIVMFIGGLIICVTWPLMWARSGQTIGQRLLRIRVITVNGGRLGYPQALLRLLALCFLDGIVFGLPLGELWHFVDPKRRTWHDLVAGSVVIKVPR